MHFPGVRLTRKVLCIHLASDHPCTHRAAYCHATKWSAVKANGHEISDALHTRNPFTLSRPISHTLFLHRKTTLNSSTSESRLIFDPDRLHSGPRLNKRTTLTGTLFPHTHTHYVLYIYIYTYIFR